MPSLVHARLGPEAGHSVGAVPHADRRLWCDGDTGSRLMARSAWREAIMGSDGRRSFRHVEYRSIRQPSANGKRHFERRQKLCERADGLSHAVITAARPEGRQMLGCAGKRLSTDRSWWTPLGMRASGSHVVSFNSSVDVDTTLRAKTGHSCQLCSSRIAQQSLQSHAARDVCQVVEWLRGSPRAQFVKQRLPV